MRPQHAALGHDDVARHDDVTCLHARARGKCAVVAGARSWSARAGLCVLLGTTVASTAVPQPAWARTLVAAPTRTAAAKPSPLTDAEAIEAPVDDAPREGAPQDDASDPDVVRDDAPVDDAAPDDVEPEAEPPAPSRGRFRESPPPPSLDAATQGGPAPSVEPPGGVVGGYWDLRKTAGREPPDGDDEIIAGSILVPLGTLSVASAASMVWLSAPGHCSERWQSIGATPTRDQCKGLLALSIVRVSYGSLMLITGAVLLGVGVTRRNKHRFWERGGSVGAWLDGDRRGRPTAGGLTWTWRFGAARG